MSQAQKSFYHLYAIDSASYKYGRMGDMLDQSRRGFVEGVGSSTTVTATNTGTGTIASVRVADSVWFVLSQALTARKVATVVDAENFTVNSAVTLGTDGVPWYLRQFDVGTADTAGWHSVWMYDKVAVLIDILNMGTVTGGIDVQIQTKGGDDVTAPVTVYENNLTAVGNVRIDIDTPVLWIRVGVKAGAAAGSGSSVSAELVGNVQN